MTPFDLAASSKTKAAGARRSRGRARTADAHRLLRHATRAHRRTAWNMPLPAVRRIAFAERSLASARARGLQPDLAAAASVPRSAARRRGSVAHVGARRHRRGDEAERRSQQPLRWASRTCSRAARALQRSAARRAPAARARSIRSSRCERSAPGRFGSRVYGFDYVPNSTVAPFSFLGPGQATPIVADPATAFADLTRANLAEREPPAPARSASRRFARRCSTAVAREYDLLAPRLDSRRAAEARRSPRSRPPARDEPRLQRAHHVRPAFDGTRAHATEQFMQLVRVGLRVRSHARRDVHRAGPAVPPSSATPRATRSTRYAHQSIEGATSCGTTYSPLAEQAMIDLGVWLRRTTSRTCSQQLDSRRRRRRHAARSHDRRVGHRARRRRRTCTTTAFTLVAGGCERLLPDRPLRALPARSSRTRCRATRASAPRTTDST